MIGYILVGVFLILLLIGIPIAFVIGIVAFLGIINIEYIPEMSVPMRMMNELNSFVLLAVPLFILVANLMNQGKISEKLIEFALAIVGSLRGGLAQANILVSMMFAGVSGASQADTAGVGKILIPSMKKNGYDDETAVGVTAASSTVGVVIPPSIPMIIFAGITNASVGALFLAGIVPGILVALAMMVFVYFVAKKRDFQRYERVEASKFFKLLFESLPALLTPIIIIGGIVAGVFTATEAAAVAAVYTLLVSMFFYKTLKLSHLPKILFDTLSLSSLSLFALAAAGALGELMGYYQLGMQAQAFFTDYIDAKWIFIIITILFFLFIGTFMDAIPAMILFVPVILPTAAQFGLDPVHLGLIVVMTLAVGLVTPPYGLCLLLASKIGNLPIERSFRAVIPYMSIILIVLGVVAFFPEVAMYVPKMLNPDLF
ncbi:TRAP transporter, DctM subunit [Lentibacillus persicus]|uniref:TRAP transporter, DctM subunit n=1 Tax=Lentibacillus persicus TaxID=640948 RepID=A0A1I1UNA1_9BACI|nr:TRAP transporter large permease [Lentibacillus persicus]SFD69470.1 TRAP transporter, DctM subunit [Lentibacillus persicus]